MAFIIELIQGTRTLDLMDGTNYKALTTGMNLSQPEPDILVHAPDFGPNSFIRVEDRDRVATIPLLIGGTDGDVMIGNIIELRRWINEAFRYELYGDTTKVQLRLKRDGATTSTYHTIRGGSLNDSAAHYNQPAATANQARQCTLVLYLTPYGERSSPYILRNDLGGACGMEDFESNLAWGLTAVGTVTTSKNTSTYLSAGGSQQVTAAHSAAEARGVRTASVTAAIGSNACGFVWIQANASGNDPITIALTDGANTGIDSVEFDPATPAGYDYSVKDQIAGNTWYRYSVSGSNSGLAADFRLRVTRLLADSTQETIWRIDNIYLQTGTLNVPSRCWMSSSNIDNRNDASGTADSDNINYIDINMIPGDAPALVTYKLDLSTGQLGFFYAGRSRDGIYTVNDKEHWIESDTFDSRDPTARWSTPADSAYTNGSRCVFTETVTPAGGYIQWLFTGTTALKMFSEPVKLILYQGTDNTNVTYTMTVIVDGETLITGPSVEPGGVAAFVDLGTINLAGILKTSAEIPDTTNYPNVYLRITIGSELAEDEYAAIDAMLLIPLQNEAVVYKENGNSAQQEIWINGASHSIISEEAGIDRGSWTGTLWELEPGLITNRVIWFQSQSIANYAYAIQSTMIHTVEITPRTRHLLGTL